MFRYLIFSIFLPLSTILAQTNPHLVLEQPEYNFGEVAEGTIVEHQFKLSNTGNAVLEIRKINPSCGCTAAVVDSDKVAPGESTFIKASFNTSGFRGVKDKRISVYSNDPENVVVTLALKGKINTDVVVNPMRVFLGDVAKGSSATAEVRVYSEQGKSIQFGLVKSRNDLLSVTSSNLDNGGKLLKVSLSKQAPLGDFHGRISIATSSKLNPLINIPVIAFVHGDLLITPKSLSLGVFEGPLKESVRGKILIDNTSSNPISIKSVSTSSSNLSADFSTIKPGTKYSINVELSSGSSGVIQSEVVVKTDHPDVKQQEVTIPVYAIINPAQDS